ncbi:response regulator [Spirosoma sp. KNUC1025]|uniref:response regulator n=1 Tax=Spirosoma sp. KNUC1025 TaxID=2894082 RepID=UPI00386847F4|nr:response regulator [Spirosoma sp. KNUC1025]
MLKEPSHSVFIADDDDDDLYMLQLAFQQHAPDCRLEIASNGIDLLDLIKRSPVQPCLVILDINMPFMDGFEVLQTLRANPDYTQTPIVVLTTSRQDWDRQRAFELGANAFITKPTNLATLNQIIRQLNNDWQLDRYL